MASLRNGTLRANEHVLELAGERFHLQVDKAGQRHWRASKTSAQGPIPTVEQVVSMADYSQGAGFSFEGYPRTYEQAKGFDATAPGKLGTWPRLAVGQSFTTTDSPSQGIQIGQYHYACRGRYVVKYAPDDTQGATWPILEIHDLGSGNTIAGDPEQWQGKGYFPRRTGTSGALQLFHELTTVNTTVAESQTVAISGTPTAGSYILTYDGKSTAAIAFNAAASVVQAALRLIPGLELVTVTSTGTIPNFTHTVVLTGVGAGLGLSSPAQMTNTDNTTGGTHAIANATTVAGTTDVWNVAAATLAFSNFRVWRDQLRGSISNLLYSVSTTPLVAANWAPAIGSGYAVGDSGQDITGMVPYPYPSLLVVANTAGLWTFADDLTTSNELPDLSAVPAVANGKGVRYSNGYILLPHVAGLVRWRPGAYQFVGPEQEGGLEGLGGRGWGRAAGIATYGRYTFVSLNDAYHGEGAIVSLQPPRDGQTRKPVVPHVHQRVTGSFEALTVVTKTQQPTSPRTPTVFSDDNAVGTIAWTDPSNAGAADDTGATVFSTAGDTHYLKGLNPSLSVPSLATILGVLVEIRRRGSTTLSIQTTDVDGYVVGASSASYATARTTTPGSFAGSGGSTLFLGQALSGGNYQNFEAFVSFDTSAIPDTATVVSATLQLTPGGLPSSDATLEARAYNFGATVTTADFVDGSTLSAKTLCASAPVTPATPVDTPIVLTSTSDFPAAINKTGSTRFVIGTAAMASGVAPVGNDGWSVYGYAAATPSFRPILTIVYRTTVDKYVKLVVGGAVVGSNYASASQWPSDFSYAQYGGGSDLWGTGGLTPAQVNDPTFGTVVSATVGTGEAVAIDHVRMTVYYSLPSAGDPTSFLVALQVASDGTVTPYVYKLPRADLTVVNDPNIARAVSDASFDEPRLYAPSREIVKTFRAREFWCDLSPEANTPGLELWATVDDGTAFQLLDETGTAATILTSGAKRLFYPQTADAVGHFSQLQYRIPATAGQEVALQCDIRDGRAYMALHPKRTEAVDAIVILGDGEFEDGTSMRTTITRQRALLEALAQPGTEPSTYHDPVTGEDGYITVENVSFVEAPFSKFEVAPQIATLQLRKLLFT